MRFNVIAFLILVSVAGALAQAQPAPGALASDATAAAVEERKRKAHAAAIADCEAMWDRGTHMTRTEWSRACRRVQDRLWQLGSR